ncbi:MAG: hypothetical protein IGS03_08810 [Candidatus Sericytochromatia bacterium]|nr:hypothetical protein [Candidatus Sericytochromatia bacterium]
MSQNAMLQPSESDQNPSSRLHAESPYLQEAERFFIALIRAGTHISIEALDNTQQVLDHVEKLGYRLKQLKQQLDKFTTESRLQAKEDTLALCRDAREVGLEISSSLGVIGKAALDEAQDLGKNSEALLKLLLRPVAELQRPLQRLTARQPGQKPPTVIPISIQDN